MANEMRGEIAFPEAGEGVVLRLLPSHLLALEKRFGKDWLQQAALRFIQLEMEPIFAVVEIGAWKDGKQTKVDLDKVDITMSDLAARCMDAIYLCIHGKLAADFFRENAAQAAEAADRPSPTEGSET